MAWWNFVSPFRFRNFRGCFQGCVNEVELGRHTIKSHGAVLVKKHVHDWIILLLLIATEIMLNMIHPFQRFVGKNMMTDLKYPLKSNTVPTFIVPAYAIVLPIGIFLLFYSRKRDVYDLHHATLGLLYAVLITGVITDALKNAVGRPRPDFFWRCFPDGVEAYDKLGNVRCHGKRFEMREAYKSFPSGHTTWSFAGLGFLSLYLSGKIKAFDRRGHVAKLCILFFPLLVASLVAISRVDDYWHHWQDVFASGLIGLAVAAFCYLQFFPPPCEDEGWGPYAYFEALDESRSRTNTVHPVNAPHMQPTEAAVQNQQVQLQRSSGLRQAISLPVKHESRLIINDIESGTR